MNASIANWSEQDDVLSFTLSNVNVSIANALRRTVLSDIPTVVFRTAPHDKSKATIEVNTGRLNNEIIKQRLSCVPIHTYGLDIAIQDYIAEIDVTNDTSSVLYVTTKDIRVKNKTTNKYISEANLRHLFPPHPITNDFIILARLRPKVSLNEEGEALKLTCEFDVGTAKENGAFNVVSLCAYGNTQDRNASALALSKSVKDAKRDGTSDEDLAILQKNWDHLEGKRYFIKDSFDFAVKSIGVYPNMHILQLACLQLKKRIQRFDETLDTAGDDIIQTSESTLQNSFDVTMKGEDYTLGKVLEFIIYDTFYDGNTGTLSYCGFRKPHPHIDESIIRIAFKSEDGVSKSDALSVMKTSCRKALEAIEKLTNELSD